MNAVREVFNIQVPGMGEIACVEKPCLLCGKREFTPVNTFVLNAQRFHTVRCQQDGMMWLEPQPDAAFYQWLYGERYHMTNEADPLLEQATLDVHTKQEEIQHVAQIRLAQIEEFKAGGHLMEIGYASGAMLELAQRQGWRVVGLELDAGCVQYMQDQGIEAYLGSLLDYPAEAESFDVISMYSVIEHTLDPADYLQRAQQLLKPGGILVLRLPDTEASGPVASLIAHTYHFNAHTLMVLLRRCRLEVLRIESFTWWKPKLYPGGQWSMNVISRKG